MQSKQYMTKEEDNTTPTLNPTGSFTGNQVHSVKF